MKRGMLSQEMILDVLNRHTNDIRAYGVKRLGLFGSYARGQQQHGSDIDLLVEFEEGAKTFDNYMELKFFLEDLFDCDVDLVIAEAVKPELKPFIYEEIWYASNA